MGNLIHPLLVLLARAFHSQLERENRFLKLESQILRSKVKGRIVPTPEDRARLVRYGRELGSAIKDTISIVTPTTFMRWVRQADGGPIGKRSGRPRKSAEVRQLVIRMANENPDWGCKRIEGELKKLEIQCCSNTVKAILIEAGIGPQPGRRKNTGSTWNEFMRIHANSIVAADFLTKEVWTLAGKFTCYILFFIHIGSRKVHICPPTYSPNGQWMAQQARNLCMEMQDWPEDQKPKYLVHDRDTKFTDHFRRIIGAEGARYVQIPKNAPDCNAYAEAWVASLKRECLNHITCFGRRHLGHVLGRYEAYYNEYRPHQSKGNRTLRNTGRGQGAIRCESWLGGLLKHYHRESA